jgi:opacity protein-like surface antigen
MKRFYPLLFLICCNNFLLGQGVHIKFNTSVNHVLIPTTRVSVEYLLQNSSGFNSKEVILQETFNNNLGISAGGKIQYELGKKFYLETGIDLSLVRFQRKFQLVFPEEINQYEPVNGQSYGNHWTGRDYQSTFYEQSEKVGKTSILYLNIPVELGYSFNEKFNIKSGLVIGTVPYSETYVQGLKMQNGTGYQVVLTKDRSSNGINNFNLALNAGISYKIIPKISADLNYSKYFTSIYYSNENAHKAKIHLFNLGFSYYL